MTTPRPSNARNRRRVFRLRLPAGAMLVAMIGGETHDVVEVSEYSIWVTSKDVIQINGACEGSIRWSNGEISEFKGQSGRIRNHGRVIWQVDGISTRDIVGEQRRLIAKYPMTS